MNSQRELRTPYHPLDDETLRRPRCHPDLLSWQRAETPFCSSDSALKAFRHLQNPRKPRPLDARVAPGQGTSCANIDQNIIAWVKSASVNEKQLAFNLMRCLAAAPDAGEAACNPASQQLQLQQPQVGDPVDSRLPMILTSRRDYPTTTTTVGCGLQQQQQQQQLLHQPPLRSARPASRRTDAQALFGTMGDNAFRQAKREQIERLAAGTEDYVHPGAGFLNSRPMLHSTFTVHPEWVSERTNRARKARMQKAAQRDA